MNTNNERLVTDLKHVVEDAEILLKATAGDLSEKTRAARDRLDDAVEKAREACEKLQAKTRAGLEAADRTVRDHPYPVVGAAFGLGMLVGLLLLRRK